MAWSEREVIVNLAEIFAESNSDVLVGIGDDGAVVARPNLPVVITTDMAVEGVHFKTEWSSPTQIGRKAAAANLADVIAMGGQPKYLVVALAATGNEPLEFILDLARGIEQEARLLDAQVIGGDLSLAKELVISITAFGECEKPTMRSGAVIGDDIYLSNLTGWSGAGLELLKQEKTSGELEEFAIAEHQAPSVDYENGIKFAAVANSLCDVSDSVIIQGGQLAERSGVAFELDGDLIGEHMDFKDLEQLAIKTNQNVWQLILGSGEDHAFLGTGKNLPFFKIGRVVAGNGIKLKKIPAIENGWEHFKSN
jgi:thiamine-monophosphate kinase